MRPLIVFDFETDGTDPATCQITQACFAAFAGEKFLGGLERKLIFDVSKANPEALAMNHFNAAVWEKEAITKRAFLEALVRWVKPYMVWPKIGKKSGKPYTVAKLCGFNSARFDTPILIRVFKSVLGDDVFFPFNFTCLDVMQLAAWDNDINDRGLVEFNLAALCKSWAIEQTGAHDAKGDVISTHKLMLAIKSNLHDKNALAPY